MINFNDIFPNVFSVSPLIPEFKNRDVCLDLQLKYLGIKYQKHTGCIFNNMKDNFVFKYSNLLKESIYNENPNTWKSKDQAVYVTEAHMDILKYANGLNLNNVFVFENDVLFHKDFKSIFDSNIKYLPDDWDILYIGAYYNYINSIRVSGSKRLLKFTKGNICSHGYAINGKSLNKIISDFDMLISDNKYYIIDQFLAWCTEFGNYNTYGFEHKLIEQGDMGTPYLSGDGVSKKLNIEDVYVREPNFYNNNKIKNISKSEYIQILRSAYYESK